MRQARRIGAAVTSLLVLGLTGCAATGQAQRSESGKASTSTTEAESSTSTTSPPPTSTPQSPTSQTATLLVSADTLVAGQPMTVSGDDCPVGDWASASLTPSSPNAYPAIFSTMFSTGGAAIETGLYANGATRVVSGPSGTWTIRTTVPMVFPGSSIIVASCRPPDTGAPAGFLYKSRNVMVSTPYTLAVTPGATVTSGTTLMIQPVGGDCPPNTEPFVALYQMTGPIQTLVYGYGLAHSGTYWQVSLVVPSGLNAGQYQLEADCDLSRGAIYGSYAPLIITIT